MRDMWTIEDARRLRQRDGARRARLHALIARPLSRPLERVLSIAASLFGGRVYRPFLRRAARRMNAQQVTAFLGYEPDVHDVICSAYFKAGTNWIMHICYQIAHLGEGRFDHIQDVVAWPDAAEPRYWRSVADHDAAASATGRRIIKAHLSADLVPLESSAKFIAVTRDPVDCAASGYHFFAKLYFGALTPTPDAWLEFFGSDETIAGPWHHFTATWWAERHRENVLFLCFEEMKAQPVEAIRRIAKFLDVPLTDEQVVRIADVTSFDAMKQMNAKFYPVRQTIWSTTGGKIIRKGTVGDGAGMFSNAATERFRRRMAKGLRYADCKLPYYDMQDTAGKDSA